MPTPSSRSAWRRVLGYAAIVALVGFAALPVAVAAEAGKRPLVIRVAAVIVLALILVDIRSAARRAIDAAPPSAFERLLRPRPAERPSVDRQFGELLDDVRFGPASQRYWSRVAWPRLCALADRLPGSPRLVEPARSRLRRWLGRGPSLAAIRDVVARLEERA
jgi:hypothetical protein